MRVNVKFFAIFREMTGIRTEWTEIAEGTTVEQLWKQYAARSPRVGNIRAAYAINQRLAKPDQLLRDGDEVGFLPPVSGGTREVKKQTAKGKSRITREPRTRIQRKARNSKARDAFITRRRLDLGALVKQVEFPGAGAILVFSGVVRDNAKGKKVGHLEYEAYPEMAEASMRDIIAEIRERWADVRVSLAHRIGKLKIGEASLIIAVAAPHRPEAYAASRYAIERVKAVLPVWKKEFAADGEYWVEGPVAGELPPEKAEAVARDAEYTPF
jgi:molybdopterin synthase catalytic subunit